MTAGQASDERLEHLRNRLRDIASTHLPADDAESIVKLARPAIRLDHSDAETNTRLGGGALLSRGDLWPHWDGKPLSFLALIDLEELRLFEADVRLPTSGYLNFFYEAEEQMAWGFEPSHRDGWRVIYTPADAAVEPATRDASISFPVVGLTPTQTLTIPGWEEDAVAPFFPRHRSANEISVLDKLFGSEKRRQQRREAYFGLQDDWFPIVDWEREPNHQIGGWPRLQQGPIWRDCQVVSQGLPLGTAEKAADPRVDSKLAGIEDWRLLLQLDTDYRTDWMWGDVGTLYYATRQSREPAAAMTDAWMVFQCG